MTDKKEMMIEITGGNLREIARAAYDLSEPVGMGFNDYRPGTLSETELDAVLHTACHEHEQQGIVMYMDYVFGRRVKLMVVVEGGQWFMYKPWRGHTDEALDTLLRRGTVPRAPGNVPRFDPAWCTCATGQTCRATPEDPERVAHALWGAAFEAAADAIRTWAPYVHSNGYVLDDAGRGSVPWNMARMACRECGATRDRRLSDELSDHRCAACHVALHASGEPVDPTGRDD